MVGLDDCGFAEAGLDNVRINRALNQEVNSTDFLCFLFEDADELLTDDFALCLRLGYAGKLGIKALLCVHADKIQVIRTVWTEDSLNLVAFVFAKKTVVNENAGKLFAYSLRKQHCRNRRVNAARQGAKHLAISDFFADFADGRFHEAVHLPVAFAAADFEHKVLQHLEAFHGVHNFRVELRRIEARRSIFHSCYRTDRRVCRHFEAGRHSFDIVGVTHPHNRIARPATARRLRTANAKTGKQAAAVVNRNLPYSLTGAVATLPPSW